jgi:hypothetical protein
MRRSPRSAAPEEKWVSSDTLPPPQVLSPHSLAKISEHEAEEVNGFNLTEFLAQREARENTQKFSLEESHPSIANSLFEANHLIPRAYKFKIEITQAEKQAQKERAHKKQKAKLKKLVAACQRDYNGSIFFKKSDFLSLYKAGKITHLADALEYMKKKPKGRTAKNYVNLYVESLPRGPYKNFWQNYLKKYTFSRFQNSKLITQLIAGHIKNYQDLQRYASATPKSRTRTLLKL